MSEEKVFLLSEIVMYCSADKLSPFLGMLAYLAACCSILFMSLDPIALLETS